MKWLTLWRKESPPKFKKETMEMDGLSNWTRCQNHNKLYGQMAKQKESINNIHEKDLMS